MKKNFFRLFCFIFILLVCISSFTSRVSSFKEIKSSVKDSYLEDLRSFSHKVKSLKSDLPAMNAKSLADIRKKFSEIRIQYKKVEYLTDYLDPQLSKDYFNGAPLPQLQRNSPEVTVLEPEGLQILDELLFSEEALDHKKEIVDKLTTLEGVIDEFILFQKAVPLTHREIIEAMRSSLVRLFTLGLTGFDTPGSVNAIPEAETCWLQIRKITFLYIPELKKKNKELADKMVRTLEGGKNYFKQNRNFEDFNRLEFLKMFLNPLYGDLLDMHLAFEIETFEEVSYIRKAVNYYSKNIFASNFLSPFAFTSLQPGPDLEKKEDLGRLLFFDPVLSGNNKRACASCHNPDKAFTDGLSKSMAFDFNGSVQRNAPTLVNAVFADKYFYDLRAQRLEDQVEHVMVSEKEFHSDFFKAGDKLLTSPEYVQMFKEAFPQFSHSPVSRETITQALAAYVQSLVAMDSEFDKYVRNEVQQLDASAERGFNLFMGKAACGTCHFAPHFSGLVPPYFQENESEVLGVPESNDSISPKIDTDMGRFHNKVMLEKADIFQHSFKTPTLRNVELTAPYMHNGVFKTLDEVMDFYNNGGGAGLNIDLANQTLPSDSLNLSISEISDIISFLKSLTDTSRITSKPALLPVFPESSLFSDRLVGGEY